VCIRAKERYTTALWMQCGARFRDAFLADNYLQVEAANEAEYAAAVQAFPCVLPVIRGGPSTYLVSPSHRRHHWALRRTASPTAAHSPP
jgi:hypothetical protein